MAKVEVDEYECAKCGYKWISRVNGVDKPRPERCTKCKRWDWNEGYIGIEERHLRNRIKYLIRRIGPYDEKWVDKYSSKRLLGCRPSIEDMKLIIMPMCYLYKQDGKGWANRQRASKQLVEYFIEKYSAPKVTMQSQALE